MLMGMINLLHGDCLEQMKALDDNSVDSIVSDPPYGISFMAKKWDYDVPSVEVWKEAMRVLKPGGHALIACGTRTQHRMVVNIEDAGFEIRDVVSWIYGSGFPKSLNISKAIDKAAGAERELVPRVRFDGKSVGKNDENKKGWKCSSDNDLMSDPTPATEEAKQWDGWGTALKPSCEFFTLCRKPLSESTIAKNVLKWGTGGINIDGCRVDGKPRTTHSDGNYDTAKNKIYGDRAGGKLDEPQGRFPANLIHSGEQEVLELFPETKSAGKARSGGKAYQDGEGGLLGVGNHEGNGMRYGDNGGSAARFFKTIPTSSFKQQGEQHDEFIARNPNVKVFIDEVSSPRAFYCAKASKKDRDEGLEGFEEKEAAGMAGNMIDGQRLAGDGTPIKTPIRKNNHPTVKPTALMAYLCRLITPTGGVVLDPYMGSGSTGKAAVREGFSFVGCELDKDYYEIAKARVNHG